MKLLPSQKNKLAEIIEQAGYDINEFEIIEDEITCIICAKSDKQFCFRFSETIQDSEYCDIYYMPTKKQVSNHIFLSINSFTESISYFNEWLDCLSSELYISDKWNKTN